MFFSKRFATHFSLSAVDALQDSSHEGVYIVEDSPPPIGGVGGNKIKGFGDGEKSKAGKKRKKFFLRFNTYGSTRR